LIRHALYAELRTLPARHATDTTPERHARLLRHGHPAKRAVLAGIGPVPVRVPRVRDRGQEAEKCNAWPHPDEILRHEFLETAWGVRHRPGESDRRTAHA